MSKIRESGLLKFLAGLFLGIGIIAGIVSGIFAVGAISEDYYGSGGEERVKERIIEQIAWFYNQEAIHYYQDRATSEKDNAYQWAQDYYEDLFAEENTNYMFSITSMEKGREGKELLANYHVDDVQYKGEIETSVDIVESQETISCKLEVSDIIRPVSREDAPQSKREGYEDDQWWFYSLPSGAYQNYDYGYVAYVDDSAPDSTSVSIELPDESETDVVTEVTTAFATTEVAAEPDEIIELGDYDEDDDINYYYIDETGEELDGELAIIKEEYSALSDTEQEPLDEEGRIIYAYSYPLDLNNVYIYDNGDGVYMNIDNVIEYNLTENSEYQFVYNNFVEKTKDKDFVYKLNCEYDVNTGTYTETYEVGNVEQILLTYYVKSNLTAYDHFAQSYRLKYLTEIFDAALPVFVISCIVVLVTFAYLIWAAGHKKAVEGVYVSGFDKIPYDIILAVYGLGVLFGLYLVADNGYSLRSVIALSIPICIIIMLFPVLLNTTAVRFKVGSVLKNTLIFRTFKWIWRGVKKLLGKSKSICRYLRENVKIYWKWILGFVALGLVEFFLCMGFWSTGFTLLVLIIDFLIVGTVLVIAAINMHKLKEGAKKIASGNVGYMLDTDHMLWEFKKHGETLNSINDGIQVAVNERLKSEHMQTELITNVTHDIKTPLTSIISYVDLLSKEELNNDKAKEYVEVLSRQSERLKKLIEDLIEASKATTGNLQVEFADVDVKVLLEQSLGEFSDKLETQGLKPIVKFHTEDTVVRADGKHLWRVFDNLINNISKYAQDNTRVYIDVERIIDDEAIEGMSLDEIVKNNYNGKITEKLKVSFKNISREELNISGEELMERFVRGDKSRNTEGNGLGLSIARSLMKLQNGDLQIVVDGDLFKVEILL